mgnify:CR=1 FL=1
MAKFGFLSVLEEELDKHLDYDFAMDWDKKNHAVEVTFILEAQNSGNAVSYTHLTLPTNSLV